ncbi:PilZ domain-containing protein [Pseudomonas cichorii]|uniref:PilZ domain-containing protein n=1 Tax=Pseudomonas serbiensis TaxID=3064350 RepID=A0ABT9CN87_9PSED|nr:MULTISPECIES: PilZ domain-containing protein [Pseudomonas]MDO7926162.1 PilZ domain-containing protein [Pseudomonas sp. KFB-138]GFM81609.1 PilZ domain-containing protein [Pseudomonas cichorii]GFM86924.1 PilZ domain-containing protein [Pseudomonas cichorii]
MSTLDEEERREYYRIEDSVALEINPLSQADQASQEAIRETSALFDLLSELHVNEFESQHLLRQLDERDRVLNSFLKSLNKRIDLLGRVVAHTALGRLGAPQPVNISEGGLRFTSSQRYTPGEELSIKMVLMPQAAGLMMNATVIHCNTLENGEYETGTKFMDLPDAQRQLLARHILQRQAQQRRQALEQSVPPKT